MQKKLFPLFGAFTWLFFTVTAPTLPAQNDTVGFTARDTHFFTGTYSAYTARFDRLDRPYLYAACKELGLVIFKITPELQLAPIDTFKTQAFNFLTVNDLFQQDNYLYLALGNFNGIFTQKAGLAVIDISNPESAVKKGQWDDPAFNRGTAAVVVSGQYAYLGAMEKGIIILDVQLPDQPAFVSGFAPDLNWPAPPGLFTTPHARGLALRDSLLWVGFDAGGLRIINVADKLHPFELAHYINPVILDDAAVAYNNILPAGNLLYAAVDYCGLDVVDITAPAVPLSAGWANPWDCTINPWDGCPGHSNQLVVTGNLLFLSGGDTEVLAFDLSTPASPLVAGSYGAVADSMASWGVDVRDSLLALALVYNPGTSPYVAKYGGIRLLSWRQPGVSSTQQERGEPRLLQITPNPAETATYVQFELEKPESVTLEIRDALGRLCLQKQYPDLPAGNNKLLLNCAQLQAGSYYLCACFSTGRRSSLFLVR